MTASPGSDVAVVGGGPAGLATAVALARAGFSVTVFEATRQGRFRIGETVPPDVQPLLENLGIWRQFVADGHLPAGGTCSAWGSSELAWIDGFTHSLGGGWHVERGRFEETLAERAVDAGASLVSGARLVRTQPSRGGGWELLLRNSAAEVQGHLASFLVDASGRACVVARRCGGAPMAADPLVAVFALFDGRDEGPGDRHTLIEAVEHGWWYAALLPGGRRVACFFTDADLMRHMAIARPAVWYRLLEGTRHVHAFLDNCPPPVRVGVASARSHCLRRIQGQDWLAVGDAATAWDPLASAGIVLALRSGLQGADAIRLHASGETQALVRYEREIQARYTRYLLERRSYYEMERRWPSSEFWRRRRPSPAVSSVR